MSKVVVITGAGRGIGRATAVAAAHAGARVFGLARTPRDLEQTRQAVEAAGGCCDTRAVDVTDRGAVQEAVQDIQAQAGRIDALINNAGSAPLAAMAEYDIAAFDAQVDVNIRGVFYAIRAVWPLMIQQGGGCIVNLSSQAAVDPFPGFQAYGASKAWVNALTRSLAAEGRPHGIRVYAVAPGAVDTAMLREHFPDFPAEQCLAPAEVGEAITWLLEHGGRYASGSIVPLLKG